MERVRSQQRSHRTSHRGGSSATTPLQDGDNAAPGDDSIPLGLLFPLTFLSANGQTSTTVTVPQKTIAWANLNEDADDDEIRAVVTLTPQMPLATSRESLAVVVTSP